MFHLEQGSSVIILFPRILTATLLAIIILLINHELNNRLTGLVSAKLTNHRGERARGQADLINTFDPR